MFSYIQLTLLRVTFSLLSIYINPQRYFFFINIVRWISGIARRSASAICTRPRRHAALAALPPFAADADNACHRLHRDHQARVEEADADFVGFHQVGNLEIVLQRGALVARTEPEA